jgi:protein-S-isoprenylcysteine O-methyltransferase Ste14
LSSIKITRMTSLFKRAFIGGISFQLVLAVLLFLPAWTLRFWQAWAYWILFCFCTLTMTPYFLKHDPQLVERRLEVGPGAEQRKSQKIIQAIAGVLTIALFVVPGLDHRFQWSSVPAAVVLLSDVLVVLALMAFFFVFRENSYAASTVKVEADQQVITTGPYRVVRHPMYAGAIVMFLATPIALSSLWALIVAVPLCGVIIVRLLDEERYLSANLRGYDDYCGKVRYRLAPFVW